MSCEHPFNKASADVILRSSDGDDFRVHKVILSEASSVFEGMFSLPQPTNLPGKDTVEALDASRDNAIPVVELPDKSDTLTLLLRHCYPMSRPVLDDFQAIIALLEAMKKYEMDDIAKDVRNVLLSDRFCKTVEDAFAVYAAAWRLDLKDDLAGSARATFRFKLPSFTSPILNSMPPAAVFALMEFRTRCLSVATDFLSYPYSWTALSITRWAGTEHEDVRESSSEELHSEYSYCDRNDFEVKHYTVVYGCRRCVWKASDSGYPQASHPYSLEVGAKNVRDELVDIMRDRPCGSALRDSVVLRRQTYGEEIGYGRQDPCALCVADGVQTVSEVLEHLGETLDARLWAVPFSESESEQDTMQCDLETDMCYRRYD